MAKVLVLRPYLRRILSLGDKKSSESQALLAGWTNKICLLPLGNEEEHWKRLLVFGESASLHPLPFLFLPTPSWFGTAWGIVLEIINESLLSLFERLRDYSCFEGSRNSRKSYPKLFPECIVIRETISSDAYSSTTQSFKK